MTTAEQLAALDATDQAELVRSGQISPTEMVDVAIAAVERINPSINAIIHPRFDAARSEASSATGPFAGVPIVVKDLGCAIAGEPHHRGGAEVSTTLATGRRGIAFSTAGA